MRVCEFHTWAEKRADRAEMKFPIDKRITLAYIVPTERRNGSALRFGRHGAFSRASRRREMESYKYEVTVRKVHPGEWVYRDNVLFPRENEEYAFDCDVYRIDEYGRRTHEGTWMNSGSKRQMVDYLASKGFDYAPRKRVYR